MATLSKHRPVNANPKNTTVGDGRKSGRRFWLGVVGLIVAALGGMMFFTNSDEQEDEVVESPDVRSDFSVGGSVSTTQGPLTLEQIPFNGQRAYEHLVAICEIGPRKSGSQGMLKQQEMLREHFTSLGGKVVMQEFAATEPEFRNKITMANMIVQWHPDRKERILLCAHYDTRPFPDRDPTNKKGVFVGANDGASGTALLCELGRHMPDLESSYGVDFVLFDGEELVYNDRRDEYFLGSEHFAKDYVRNRPPYRYRAGILLDMVADADLQLFYEGYSHGRYKQSRDVNQDIWGVAAKLGVKDFVPRVKHTVKDDHLWLLNTARIPTIDIIDFDYPHWHTTGDTPDKCSALSLAKVGWVVLEYLKALE